MFVTHECVAGIYSCETYDHSLKGMSAAREVRSLGTPSIRRLGRDESAKESRKEHSRSERKIRRV